MWPKMHTSGMGRNKSRWKRLLCALLFYLNYVSLVPTKYHGKRSTLSKKVEVLDSVERVDQGNHGKRSTLSKKVEVLDSVERADQGKASVLSCGDMI
jgi:hypothetical protein